MVEDTREEKTFAFALGVRIDGSYAVAEMLHEGKPPIEIARIIARPMVENKDLQDRWVKILIDLMKVSVKDALNIDVKEEEVTVKGRL